MISPQSPSVGHLAVDEVSAQRGHRYLTIVSDRDSGHVLHVEPQRKQASLEAFYKQLTAAGDDSLKHSRHWWLYNPENLSEHIWEVRFSFLRKSSLKTARAWAIKEAARELWDADSRKAAEADWNKWYGWAIRSRLEPVKKTARMVKKHLDGIVNATVFKASNAMAEAINRKIQHVKRMACGFRNDQRFQRAIYFHLGGRQLYP